MNQYGPDILILNSNSREKCLPFFTHTHKKLKEQNGSEAHGVRLGPAGLTDKGSFWTDWFWTSPYRTYDRKPRASI